MIDYAKDPLEELYRKPDPTFADGQNLTSMYGRFPEELFGKQIEDIDFYYRNKKVSLNNILFTVFVSENDTEFINILTFTYKVKIC